MDINDCSLVTRNKVNETLSDISWNFDDGEYGSRIKFMSKENNDTSATSEQEASFEDLDAAIEHLLFLINN